MAHSGNSVCGNYSTPYDDYLNDADNGSLEPVRITYEEVEAYIKGTNKYSKKKVVPVKLDFVVEMDNYGEWSHEIICVEFIDAQASTDFIKSGYGESEIDHYISQNFYQE